TYHFQNQPNVSNNAAQQLNSSYANFTATEPNQLWTDIFNDPERIGFAAVRCPPDKTRCTAADTNPYPYSPRDQMVWYVQPLDNQDVNYAGDQSVEAGYGMIDLPLIPSVNFVAGARYETTKMSIVPEGKQLQIIEQNPESGDRFISIATPEEASADIDDADILPSAGLVYSITPEMKLRGTWSKTI